jgi:hypothetical protein
MKQGAPSHVPPPAFPADRAWPLSTQACEDTALRGRLQPYNTDHTGDAELARSADGRMRGSLELTVCSITGHATTHQQGLSSCSPFTRRSVPGVHVHQHAVAEFVNDAGRVSRHTVKFTVRFAVATASSPQNTLLGIESTNPATCVTITAMTHTTCLKALTHRTLQPHDHRVCKSQQPLKVLAVPPSPWLLPGT